MAFFAPAIATAQPAPGGDEQIMRIIRRHCAICHSQNPSHTMLLGQQPPKGVVLDSIEDVRQFADRILNQVVKLRTMPFGNETAMSAEERAQFAPWLAGR